MKISGLIYDIYDSNIFTLIIDGHKEYFYIAKNLNKKFSKVCFVIKNSTEKSFS